MQAISVARQAMATRFEIVLHGADEPALRAAGEEALEEISRLDRQLSRYDPASEISRINACAAREPVRIDAELFRLLQRARRLQAATDGAFDLTLGPLMQAWGFVRDSGRLPAPETLDAARRATGMRNLELDDAAFTVRFLQEDMKLDLGAIGKGYALDCATGVLRDAGIGNALLHGGTSTVAALGHAPDGSPWKVAVPQPEFAGRWSQPGARPEHAARDEPGILAVVPLHDESLSVSGVWGKSFEVDGRVYGHILDPRRGEPVEGAIMSVVVCPSAADSDALSTALLVLGADGQRRLRQLLPDARSLVVTRGSSSTPSAVHSDGVSLRRGNAA